MAKNAYDKDAVREATTRRVLDALEGGKIPWNRPWKCSLHGGLAFNSTTNKAYRGGMNQILLWLSAMCLGVTDPRWMGRGQAKKKGYLIKGMTNATATPIYAPVKARFLNTDGDWAYRLKGWRIVLVWNATQVLDCPSLESLNVPEVDPTVGFDKAQRIWLDSEAILKTGGERAFYDFKKDFVGMPEAGAFDSMEAYWSTIMHELVHWTGHDSRLQRGLFGKSHANYAREELVAEMGSAFVCSFLGIDKPEVTQNHEAYIQHWIEAMQGDADVFMDAANAAWKAFILLTEPK